MWLKACVNGARGPGEHPALPLDAEHLAQDVVAVIDAGADAVHLHVKDAQGADTFAGDRLAKTLAAVGAAAPDVPVGVTTGAWALPDPRDRVAAIERWPVTPAFASVNWHEEGADEVAAALLARGVDVEAGLWHAEAVAAWVVSPFRDRCTRVLLELPDGPDPRETVRLADELVAMARRAEPDAPLLLHGEGTSCWPALQHAGRRGLMTRIGLEDTLTMPDGSLAPDNAALVRAALTLLQRTS